LRSNLTCDRCGATRFWQVRAVRERAHSGLIELGVTFTDGGLGAFEWHGHFETLICRGCGFVAWYAHGLDGITLPPVKRACVECGHHEAFAIELYERDGREDAFYGDAVHLRVVRKGFPKFWDDGWFAATICAHCNRVEWTVRELSALDPDPTHGLRAESDLCRRCHGERLWNIGPIREMGRHGREPLGIDYDHKLRAVGAFSVRVCRSCGGCDWFAYQLDDLDERPEVGIVKLDKDPPGGSGPAQGPYR
jgi:hypothetical protein